MRVTKHEELTGSDPLNLVAADWVKRLGSRNSVERQQARESLVGLGQAAVGPVVEALSSEHSLVRWEAAKTFTELHAPAAAPALARTLGDEDPDVRWVAAEAMIGLGEAALRPILRTLMVSAESAELRDGAHHVLRVLNRNELADIVGPVLEALEQIDPELAVPLRAKDALAKLNAVR
ncbi:MAG: HEAT repeat domain-containing protein [Phycisphaerae bacterium]|nr:HEAT repeat domain-containing protein [Phycisphaerae bacterium]